MTATQDDLFTVDSNAVSVGSTALFGNFRKSPKQSVILAALRDKPQITLSEAVKLIGGNLYCNAEKHVGVTLSNMVKRGMIQRVKPGVFCLPNDQEVAGEALPPSSCSAPTSVVYCFLNLNDLSVPPGPSPGKTKIESPVVPDVSLPPIKSVPFLDISQGNCVPRPS